MAELGLNGNKMLPKYGYDKTRQPYFTTLMTIWQGFLRKIGVLGVVTNCEVCYNWGHMITREKKAEAMAKLARTKEDVGSPEVQVSILTERIKEVTEHVKENKHDYMAKRGLMQMVGQRKKLLKYLERTNFDLYKKTIAELGLRK